MTDVDFLSEQLRDAFGRERSGAAAEFTIAVWERLRTGGAVPPPEAAQLATAAGLSRDEAGTLLEQSAERDAHGNIVGFSGLSLNHHPHQIDFGDRSLSAWCAFDPFFLIPALGGDARVSTHDPHSGVDIELLFRDGTFVEASPASPVVSIVIPVRADGEAGCGESVETMLSAFCSQVHLFEEVKHVERYFAQRGAEALVLSIDEAIQLAAPRELDGEAGCCCGC